MCQALDTAQRAQPQQRTSVAYALRARRSSQRFTRNTRVELHNSPGAPGWFCFHFMDGETEAQGGQGHAVTRNQAGTGTRAARCPHLRSVPLC